MGHVKQVALVPVINGQPQLPLVVGSEDQCEQYWYDNPLQFLNKRVDTYEMCPACGGAYPELAGEAFGDKVCQGCAKSIADDLATIRWEAEADAAWRVTPCTNCGQATTNDGLCHDCSDMVTGDIDEPELEPCEHCRAGTYKGVHDLGIVLCEGCSSLVFPSSSVISPDVDDELPF